MRLRHIFLAMVIALPAFSQTTITKTVKTAGGDYTTLSACEAGIEGDLVTANEIRQCECYAMSDTTAVTVSGSTTDATRYMRFYTPASERHVGVWNTAKYGLEPTVAVSLYINDDHLRVEGLQIRNQTVGSANAVVKVEFVAAGADIRFGYNLFRGDGSTDSQGLEISDADAAVRIWNNIFYDFGRTFFGAIRFTTTHTAASYIFNNTFIGSYYGLRVDGGTVVKAVNNIASGNSEANYSNGGTWATGTNYNASSTATATGGANDRVDQFFTFVDGPGKDFHLTSGDLGAKDFGTDLSADANLLFPDDIDGATRSGSWDIGADEVTAAAAAFPGAILNTPLVY